MKDGQDLKVTGAALVGALVGIALAIFFGVPDSLFGWHSAAEIEQLHDAYWCGSVRASRMDEHLPRQMPNGEAMCKKIEMLFTRISGAH